MELKLILQIVGTVLGLLYLWLEYRANIWLWIIGAIMPMVHGVLYLTSGIYADAAMQLYYVAAGIYGLAVWRRRPKSGGEEIKIRHTPRRWIPSLFAVYALLHVALYFVLTEFTDSRVPVMDSMSTALSIVAMWMLSRKLVEQWLVWLIVDMISVGLYIYKDIPITGLLYTLYCVLAIAGYLRWRRMARA
ncbi:MAG: nicotinamide mononucleotide transporter [Rikenellaceae bacterium]|nr:nicotinamide mononucleotide transporter [Rikenellaceae bacterium]